MYVLAILVKEVHYCKDITLLEYFRSPTGRLPYRGKFYVPTVRIASCRSGKACQRKRHVATAAAATL